MIARDHGASDIDDHDGGKEAWDDQPDDDDLTIPCPYCHASVYDDAERCPACGQYLLRKDTPRRQPWWVVLGVVACLIMVTWWILHP